MDLNIIARLADAQRSFTRAKGKVAKGIACKKYNAAIDSALTLFDWKPNQRKLLEVMKLMNEVERDSEMIFEFTKMDTMAAKSRGLAGFRVKTNDAWATSYLEKLEKVLE